MTFPHSACPTYRDACREQARSAAAQAVEIPAWAMNAGLTDTYRTWARLHDEFRAAKECRRLKREHEEVSA